MAAIFGSKNVSWDRCWLKDVVSDNTSSSLNESTINNCKLWFCVQVLDAGKIQAYDEPYTLLKDKEGIFYKMVQQTGKQEAAALLEAAKEVRIT